MPRKNNKSIVPAGYADNGNSIFSKGTRISDLVQYNYRLLPVLARMGIKPGFGDKTVAEACAENGMPLDLFMVICMVHSPEGYIPGDVQLTGGDIASLVEYLHNSHEYYSRRQIPSLRKKLDELVLTCESAHTKVLGKFFDNYQKELENHFAYEEDKVFPYVRDLIEGKISSGYAIETFEENHSNIDEKLNDLKNIILKYLPDTCDSDARLDVLFDIFQLEEDLDKHTLLENVVLIPLVADMELKIN